MSIRLLALELYRSKQKVDSLQRQLDQGQAEAKDQKLQRELDEARREYNTIKKMFEARKNAATTSAIPGRYYRGMK